MSRTDNSEQNARIFFGHSPETFLSNLRSWKCSPLISYPLWTTLGSLRALKDRGSASRGRPIDWNHDQLLDENWLKTGFWKEIPSSFVFLSIPDNFSTNNTQLPLWNGFAFRHADLNDCSLENWEILLQIVKKLQNRPSDHDIAFGNEVAWSTLDHQTPRYGTQRVCLIVPKSFVTRLKSPSQTWFVPEKNIDKIRGEPTSATKVKTESWDIPKIFLPDLYQYYTQVWYESGVHRSTFHNSSPRSRRSPT